MSKLGNRIVFGDYEWDVLRIRNGKAMLITRDCVAAMPIDDMESTEATWESCTLRKWLNNDFYNSFTTDEREHIVETLVENSNDPPDNDTSDKIFLLSYWEAEEDDFTATDEVVFMMGRQPIGGFVQNMIV